MTTLSLPCSQWSYQVSARYRAHHLRSLSLAIDTIFRKQGVENRFASVRSLARKDSAGKCDICGEVCSGLVGSVSCLLCESLVHRSCYRGCLLLKSTWERWLCDRCFVCGLKNLDPSTVLCALCQQCDGAIKWTSGLGWVHPGCVLLSEKAEFADDTYSSARAKAAYTEEKTCCYCGKANPWTTKCFEKLCSSEFHAKCALKCSRSPTLNASINLRCISHNPQVLVPQKPAFIAQGVTMHGEPATQVKTIFIDTGEELEVVTVPVSEEVQFKVEPVAKSKPRGSRSKLKLESCTPHKVSLRRSRQSDLRVFFSSIQKETQITTSGTVADLQSRLKLFLRSNQLKADYNFYDISHLPELAKMIGTDGKVEHSSLEAIVLANSYVIG